MRVDAYISGLEEENMDLRENSSRYRAALKDIAEHIAMVGCHVCSTKQNGPHGCVIVAILQKALGGDP